MSKSLDAKAAAFVPNRSPPRSPNRKGGKAPEVPDGGSHAFRGVADRSCIIVGSTVSDELTRLCLAEADGQTQDEGAGDELMKLLEAAASPDPKPSKSKKKKGKPGSPPSSPPPVQAQGSSWASRAAKAPAEPQVRDKPAKAPPSVQTAKKGDKSPSVGPKKSLPTGQKSPGMGPSKSPGLGGRRGPKNPGAWGDTSPDLPAASGPGHMPKLGLGQAAAAPSKSSNSARTKDKEPRSKGNDTGSGFRDELPPKGKKEHGDGKKGKGKKKGGGKGGGKPEEPQATQNCCHHALTVVATATVARLEVDSTGWVGRCRLTQCRAL